jgi:predicted Zn-dependent protease
MIRQISQIMCAVLIYLILVQCAVNPVTGEKELMLVSESQEIDMGKEFYPSALWGDLGGGGAFRDEQLHSYLRDIVLRIQAGSHRPNLPVDFAIQNSSIPNAWAIPGHVVITRGLLAGLENEAEFVFVMGHEMGHVAARHSARHMTYGMLQQVGLGAAGIALSGSDYANLALGVGAVGSSLLLLKYGRDDELEADRLGIEYMARLGYDPQNALSAHRNLEKISGEYLKSVGKEAQEKGFFEDLLSTHPRTSVRIDELRVMINRMQPFKMAGDGTYRERYQTRTAGLRDTNSIYLEYYDSAARAYQKNNLDEAGSLIEKALGKDHRQPAFHALKGFILLKRKDYAPAKSSFQTAMNIDKEYAPAYRGMGILSYNQNNYREGIDYLNWSLSLFPQDASSHYFLGMSYFRMNNYQSAIPHLKAFAEAQPKHPEVFGTLGICYEKSGDLSSAYQAYALQVRVAPDSEMGKHAASRIAILKPALQKQTR